MRNFIYDSLSLSVCSEILAEIGSLCGQAHKTRPGGGGGGGGGAGDGRVL